jgi:hypothetical protein
MMAQARAGRKLRASSQTPSAPRPDQTRAGAAQVGVLKRERHAEQVGSSADRGTDRRRWFQNTPTEFEQVENACQKAGLAAVVSGRQEQSHGQCKT